MPRPKKKAHEMTTKEAMKRLFPHHIRKEIKAVLDEHDKPKKRKKQSSMEG